MLFIFCLYFGTIYKTGKKGRIIVTDLEKRIWIRFRKCEANDFTKARHISLKEIRRVGIEKFIRANGWKTPQDVTKWRDDLLEVVPCPHCKQDFGVLDDSLGLCDSCLTWIDIRKFYEDLYATVSEEDTEKMSKALVLFYSDPVLRNQYIISKEEHDARITEHKQRLLERKKVLEEAKNTLKDTPDLVETVQKRLEATNEILNTL